MTWTIPKKATPSLYQIEQFILSHLLNEQGIK